MFDIKFIIFDLGHVLVDVSFEKGDDALAKLASKYAEGEKAGAQAVDQFRDTDAYKLFARGQLTPLEFMDRFCQTAGIPEGRLEEKEFKTAWMEYLIQPMPGMGEIVEALARRARKEPDSAPRLAMLSNTDEWHWQACQVMVPAFNHFPKEYQFSSFQMGMSKPDPAIFTETVKRLGVEPDQCVMIDDLVANIQGAAKADLKALIFTDAETLKTHLTAMNLL